MPRTAPRRSAGVFLGLTVGCATCHDHKFDPISQREFYALTAFFRNTTQYVMDGNISDPPPTLVVPRDEDRDTWRQLREEVGEIEDALAPAAGLARTDLRRVGWRAAAHGEIEAPLGTASEILSLDLDGEQPVVVMNGERQPVVLHEAARIEPGPNGLPALFFGDNGSAELPPLKVDTDTPFSLALWIHMPEAEGSYTVASQSDPTRCRPRLADHARRARAVLPPEGRPRRGRAGERRACRSTPTTRSA